MARPGTQMAQLTRWEWDYSQTPRSLGEIFNELIPKINSRVCNPEIYIFEIHHFGYLC